MPLSPGKLRGLQATSTARQAFTILALDHGASFLKLMPPGAGGDRHAEVVAAKHALVQALAPWASGVLLDPVHGLEAGPLSGGLPGPAGLLLSVEDGDYAAASRTGQLLEGWSVAKARRCGADAVKLFFYYAPDSPDAPAQEGFVRGVAEACARHDLPLFAEPITYGQAAGRRQRVAEAARRIGRLGADVLKLEFPVDVRAEPDERAWAEACREVSAACPVPWVLLSGGEDFELFTRQLTAACQAGASGYAVGRAVWKDVLGDLSTGPASAVSRLERLAAIAAEHARPWTDIYPLSPQPAPGWYRDYPEA